MLIKKEEFESIKNNKVTFIKDFTKFSKTYDFNFISEILNKYDLQVFNTRDVGYATELQRTFKIVNTSFVAKEFKIIENFLDKIFKYTKDDRDLMDIYVCFVSQVSGAHQDMEDVFIINVKGSVIYQVSEEEEKYYKLDEGDLIYIPKNVIHKAIGVTPRITISYGYFGEMKI